MNKELSKEEELAELLMQSESVQSSIFLIKEYATKEKRALEKQNKELKEEIERLTKICNGCFETIHNKSVEIEKLKAGKLNKSNY